MTTNSCVRLAFPVSLSVTSTPTVYTPGAMYVCGVLHDPLPVSDGVTVVVWPSSQVNVQMCVSAEPGSVKSMPTVAVDPSARGPAGPVTVVMVGATLMTTTVPLPWLPVCAASPAKEMAIVASGLSTALRVIVHEEMPGVAGISVQATAFGASGPPVEANPTISVRLMTPFGLTSTTAEPDPSA